LSREKYESDAVEGWYDFNTPSHKNFGAPSMEDNTVPKTRSPVIKPCKKVMIMV